MIRNSGTKLSLSVSFLMAIIFHMAVLFIVKKNGRDLAMIDSTQANNSRTVRIDKIELIKKDEVDKMRRVGVKDGSKTKYFQPDELKISKPRPMGKGQQGLSLGNLAPVLPLTKPRLNENKNLQAKTQVKSNSSSSLLTEPTISLPANDSASHFYFNPKKEKKIPRNNEQDLLKQEAFRNLSTSSVNTVAQKLSNFEIRYERPEGVSEDELNSDEKAYYSFFKRSYASYLSKLYSTFDKVAVERPGIEKDIEGKHLLIGRIDYDEKGNIVTVKILKSSDSDDVHYFFEETLKQLNLPNPPKSFIKSKKGFSTYYQIQIN